MMIQLGGASLTTKFLVTTRGEDYVQIVKVRYLILGGMLVAKSVSFQQKSELLKLNGNDIDMTLPDSDWSQCALCGSEDIQVKMIIRDENEDGDEALWRGLCDFHAAKLERWWKREQSRRKRKMGHDSR